MFVVTGATGHTGKVVAKALLTNGEKVRVIGRNADRLKEFVGAGAEPFTADLSDGASVAKAFVGAKAAFVMIPPNLSQPRRSRVSKTCGGRDCIWSPEFGHDACSRSEQHRCRQG
jgi:uncharacterized protein YbjT (DUF2867 family)